MMDGLFDQVPAKAHRRRERAFRSHYDPSPYLRSIEVLPLTSPTRRRLVAEAAAIPAHERKGMRERGRSRVTGLSPSRALITAISNNEDIDQVCL